MSSLATQLQGIASLDAARLTSRTGAPSSKSYLFPAKVAADHDLDTIYSLGISGFEELLSLDPDLEQFEDELFSEHAKRTDRMMLNEEENKKLDTVLERCLRRLGKWIGLMAGGRCIEWLVRRFRIHEMNAQVVLQVFMPYHSTPNFARMLAILTIPQSSPYHAPFAPLVKDAQPIPRTYISTAISPEKDKSLRLLEDILGLVKQAQKEGVVYRGLLSFWTGVIVDLLDRYQAGNTLHEGLVKMLVETFVQLLVTIRGGPDLNASVYPPLILLARTVRLADEVFQTLLEAVISQNTGADPPQQILTLVVLLEDRGDWTLGLGNKGAETLAKVKQLGHLLLVARARHGFEKGLAPVLHVMASRTDLFLQPLERIVGESTLSPALAGVIATEIASNTSDDAEEMLSKLREKHPVAVDRVLKDLPNGTASKHPKSQDGTGLFEADVAARVQAIHQLVNVDADDIDIREAILARLGDDEPEVIEAIYTHSQRPEAILKSDSAYLDAIAPAFSGSNRNPHTIKLHLDFVCNHFAIDPKSQVTVFERIIFPHLLTPKHAKALDKDSWKVVFNSPIGQSGLLGGLSADRLSSDTVPEACKEIGFQLATSISSSDHEERLTNFLLAQLAASDAVPRLFASLVLIHLLAIRPFAPFGLQILAQLRPFLSNGKIQDVGESPDPLSPLFLRAICDRPDDKTTNLRGTVALIAAVSKVPRPRDTNISLHSTSAQADAYQDFATKLYTLANSDVLPSPLAQSVLRSLLTQLKEDALIFFASIWTCGPRSARLASIKHALGFVQAYASPSTANMDFQLVIPALLLALRDENKEIRNAAVAILKKISGLAEKTGSDTYALDSIYGSRSNCVQLLREADLKAYLGALVNASQDLVVDPSRLTKLHVEYLGAQNSASKKNTSHRRAVIKALLSHVEAWQDINARLVLLSTFDNVVDSTLFSGVLPLLQNDTERAWIQNLEPDIQSAYLGQLIKMLNRRTAARLTIEDEGWTFIKALFSEAGGIAVIVRRLVLQRMQDGVFEALPADLKATFVEILLETRHIDELEDAAAIRDSLPSFTLDSAALQGIIHGLAQPLEVSSSRKRQKQDNANNAERAEQAVDDLTTLIDSREWKSIPGPAAPLVAALMSVLATLLAKRSSVKSGIDYLEQEALNAILALLESIHDAEELHKARVGIEVIIKVVRASTNPRTSQRALLVISELARFIPEAVLHNVMPIFTFVGASDFQRDDAYSFSVVEKTISKIVPVLTASIKGKNLDRLEMYKEALPILSIFTDMAGRLPRHRTLPFYVHLVKSLEPGYYLAPVSMLLVDRTTTKAGRGGLSLSQAMDLPTGLATSFPTDDQLLVVRETLEEVGRLYSDPDTAFVSHNNQDNLPERTTKQINALLSFSRTILARLAGKPCAQSVIQQIVSSLVVLAGSKREGVNTLESTLAASMQLLSADNFLNVVSSALQSSDPATVEMGLGVFIQRLPLIKTEIRTRNSAVIGTIITTSGDKLADPGLAESALATLQTIVSSTKDDTENAFFAQIVPSVLSGAKTNQSKSVVVASLDLLDSLIKQLGSRTIPSIQGIIDLSLLHLQSSSETIMRQTTKVLGTLFDSVPTFVSSKQLTTILRSTMDHHAKRGEIMKNLMSSIAKKVQTKTLFPTVLDLWAGISDDRLVAFFELLRLTLRHADRQALTSLTKKVFNFFLQAFDLPWKLDTKGFDRDTINAVETSAISSFLEMVTKLNEATFRPLFTRLFDWAVIDLDGQDESHLNRRKVVLFKVMIGLLQRFRNLLSPYIGTLFPHIQELLASYGAGEASNEELWTLILDTLSKSFEVDDGAYWSDSSLLKIIPSIVPQLATPLAFQSRDSGSTANPVSRCVSALAANTTSETVLKSLNTSICLQTRNDDPRVRLVALYALQAIWEAQGDELTAFVQETVGEYLSELLEDENSDVVGLARKVLGIIEGATGAGVEEYLD